MKNQEIMIASQQTQLETPVLFLVFNRPDTTEKVFDAVRAVRPRKLYVGADGPRLDKAGEQERCNEVRRIATAVDWECEVYTYFRVENAGCAIAVSSAITWFFEHEEEGIILEDDCLPSPEFFDFCATLLEYYRADDRIMEIGGVSLLLESQRDNTYSYMFSNHNNIWGWATWRRAWKLYDFEMTQYKDVIKNGFFENYFNSVYEASYFKWVFERTFLLPTITWDYQWEFVRRINSGLTICPIKNLVVNLGFGGDATHTLGDGGESSKLQLEKLDFPLRHPEFVLPDLKADTIGFMNHHTSPSSRRKTRIKSLLPKAIQQKLFRRSMDQFVNSVRAQHNPEKYTNHSPVEETKTIYTKTG